MNRKELNLLYESNKIDETNYKVLRNLFNQLDTVKLQIKHIMEPYKYILKELKNDKLSINEKS